MKRAASFEYLSDEDDDAVLAQALDDFGRVGLHHCLPLPLRPWGRDADGVMWSKVNLSKPPSTNNVTPNLVTTLVRR